VIDYVLEKYGEDHVAQIITFGTLAARAAIKDVGRALNMPYSAVDRISKMIPSILGITIEKALKLNPELLSAYNEDESVKKLIDTSLRLEGLPRHSSTHAAGVVICDKPVMEYVPLNSNDGVITTQFTMGTIEELGLLKMDFLGLRNLTVIQDAINEIARSRGITLDLSTVPDGDAAAYELIAAGKTDGVFQLESAGMKRFMKELKPKSIEDLTAGIALYRPGPMDFIPKYIRGRNNRSEVSYTHPALKPILEDTYGCIVYQEQVMRIVRDLAGYSLGRSDILRRAMSKKKAGVMQKERDGFVHGVEGDVPGCVANGIPESAAEKIFDEMQDFASYAFNKSHAAAYAVLGYHTAYLKAHFPVEFMAALMTSVMDTKDKVPAYIEECRRMGIKLLPPDINKSFGVFSVENGKIRFGLSAVKNVGRGAILAAVKEREKDGDFLNLSDLCTRMESEINTRLLESLIKAGALDSLGGSRAQYLAAYKNIMASVAKNRKETYEGQMSLFDLDSGEKQAPAEILPDVKELSEREYLAMEKEVLGLYISGHPLSRYQDQLKNKTNCDSRCFALSEETSPEDDTEFVRDGKAVAMGGIISHKSVKYTRNNKIMAFLTLEDIYGQTEVILFPDLYEKQGSSLGTDMAVLIEGRASVSYDEAKLIASRIYLLDEEREPAQNLPPPAIRMIGIAIEQTASLSGLMDIFRAHPGNIPLFIHELSTGKKLKADKSLWLDGSDALLNELSAKLGEQSLFIK
ncbi:MAG: DNA polymerase III subunit alpha, partial [Firmicutes bacterium]|nr:DNA polymerase III subunit alpha [Bacillota bacterium]